MVALTSKATAAERFFEAPEDEGTFTIEFPRSIDFPDDTATNPTQLRANFLIVFSLQLVP
jgi:hypothetical protein